MKHELLYHMLIGELLFGGSTLAISIINNLNFMFGSVIISVSALFGTFFGYALYQLKHQEAEEEVIGEVQ